MATVLIGGDICPIGRNAAHFSAGDGEVLFQDLLQDFASADLVVANLECPLIERQTPIRKTGPVFGEETACVHGIRNAGIEVLCLANNHIMDHGAAGLRNTLRVCAQAGIATVGAGGNLGEARQILVRAAGQVRVGLLAMAEHEFSVATTDAPGANPLDVMDYVRNVAATRDIYDYLVVLVHGGQEFMNLPSPRLIDTCRFLVEMGANAVLVQHPHSFGGYETYRGGHIVYGQGALVMDEAVYRNVRSFHEGFLVALTIGQNGASTMELRPFVQSEHAVGARRMERASADRLLGDLAAKARQLLDPQCVRDEWVRFCEERKHAYLSAVLAHNRLLRRAMRHRWLAPFLYSRRRVLGTRNVVCCETHREALETIFGEAMV